MPNGSFIRQAFRILFSYDEHARIDLLRTFPAIKSFFVSRRNIAVVRYAGDIFFTLIIVSGLFGPQDPRSNISLFIAWGVWWTSVVISWFYVGKLWCGFCPFPGIGRIFQYLGLSFQRPVPDFFRKHFVHVAVFFLALIIWAEAVTDMKNKPAETAYLLLSIVLGATIFEIIYRGQAWCRYVCPMGKIIGSASILSMTEFRPDHAKCRSCKTIPCKRGRDGIPGCPVYLGAVSVRNNLDCLVCGHCIGLCERDSPQLNLRNPFVELVMNKGRYLTCSYIIPFLMGSQIARLFQHYDAYRGFRNVIFGSDIFAFTILLLAGFGLFLLIIKISSRLFTVSEDEVFGKFSLMVPVLIPMAFTGELVYRMEYFLHHLGEFLPTFGRQFGFSLDHLVFHVPSSFVSGVNFLIMTVGALAAGHVLRIFYRRDFEDMIPVRNYRILQCIVILILAGYVSLLV